jgi:hypothetical protein
MVRISLGTYFGVGILGIAAAIVGSTTLGGTTYGLVLAIGGVVWMFLWLALMADIRRNGFGIDVKTRTLLKPRTRVLRLPGRKTVLSNVSGDFEIVPVTGDERALVATYKVTDFKSFGLIEDLVAHNCSLGSHLKELCLESVGKPESWDEQGIKARLELTQAALKANGVELSVSVRSPLL